MDLEYSSDQMPFWFFYAIQFDYSKDKGSVGDPNHFENLFDYGYLGNFTTYKTPTFELGSDTVDGKYYQNVWFFWLNEFFFFWMF